MFLIVGTYIRQKLKLVALINYQWKMPNKALGTNPDLNNTEMKRILFITLFYWLRSHLGKQGQTEDNALFYCTKENSGTVKFIFAKDRLVKISVTETLC